MGGNPLDVALWQAPATTTDSLSGVHRIARVPFDHDRWHDPAIRTRRLDIFFYVREVDIDEV